MTNNLFIQEMINDELESSITKPVDVIFLFDINLNYQYRKLFTSIITYLNLIKKKVHMMIMS